MLKSTLVASMLVAAPVAMAADIIVVSHGQASDPFWSVVKNGVERAAQRTASEVTSDSVRILFVGRLEYQKGIDVLLAAAARAAQAGAEFRLLIVGEGADRKSAEDAASSTGIADRVH